MIEIFRGEVITPDTQPYKTAKPGEHAFIRHELLGNTHFVGVYCNEEDDGGVIRSFPFPNSSGPSDDAQEMLERHFAVALDLDTVSPGRPCELRLSYGTGELGRLVTYVAVHAPDGHPQSISE